MRTENSVFYRLTEYEINTMHSLDKAKKLSFNFTVLTNSYKDNAIISLKATDNKDSQSHNANILIEEHFHTLTFHKGKFERIRKKDIIDLEIPIL